MELYDQQSIFSRKTLQCEVGQFQDVYHIRQCTILYDYATVCDDQ
jgi:hypothetical protein